MLQTFLIAALLFLLSYFAMQFWLLWRNVKRQSDPYGGYFDAQNIAENIYAYKLLPVTLLIPGVLIAISFILQPASLGFLYMIVLSLIVAAAIRMILQDALMHKAGIEAAVPELTGSQREYFLSHLDDKAKSRRYKATLQTTAVFDCPLKKDSREIVGIDGYCNALQIAAYIKDDSDLDTIDAQLKKGETIDHEITKLLFSPKNPLSNCLKLVERITIEGVYIASKEKGGWEAFYKEVEN